MADRKLFKGDMVYISEDNNVHKLEEAVYINSPLNFSQEHKVRSKPQKVSRIRQDVTNRKQMIYVTRYNI